MQIGFFRSTAKSQSIWAILRRLWRRYYSGGTVDEWLPYFAFSNVIDINTKLPIGGNIMRKMIGGIWVYRAMTDEEFEELENQRQW